MSHTEGMQTLSYRQEIVLSVLLLFSSSLSILGSSSIIYKVLRNRGVASPYDRLMLGLSTADLIASIGFGITPFSAPRETSTRVWSVGTQVSCTFLGFLTQLGLGAVLYNGMLSFYFLLTIRYKVPRNVFAKKYERWMHGIAIGFSLITASVGAFLGLFSELEVGAGCWINDYPAGCSTNKDCISDDIGMVYALIPAGFTLLALIVNNTLVYLAVRKAFLKSEFIETERQIRQKLQKREVATQGFLYVAAFLICIWSAAYLRLIESYSTEELVPGELDAQKYWLLVIQSIFLPFQGFLNMLIYNRPNFVRIRLADPDLSIFIAIRRACFGSNIPKFQDIDLTGSAPGLCSRRFPAGQRNSNNANANIEVSEEETTIRICKSERSGREGRGSVNLTSGSEGGVAGIVVVEAIGMSPYTSLTVDLAPSGWTTNESEEMKSDKDEGQIPCTASIDLDSSDFQLSQSESSSE